MSDTVIKEILIPAQSGARGHYVHRLHRADSNLDLLADDFCDAEDVRDEYVVVRQPVVDNRKLLTFNSV